MEGRSIQEPVHASVTVASVGLAVKVSRSLHWLNVAWSKFVYLHVSTS